ncbi:hypothetical protein OUZ56_020710 [Daphnia magna]|uniref:Uncharacterized protein n=1 Tax=Daphnia magna TaxID=35525 RepID=A0ABQ9ZF76_9CRUS|nr:hypothetical protein OUZ56_020710 [Daphnia magna]
MSWRIIKQIRSELEKTNCRVYRSNGQSTVEHPPLFSTNWYKPSKDYLTQGRDLAKSIAVYFGSSGDGGSRQKQQAGTYSVYHKDETPR